MAPFSIAALAPVWCLCPSTPPLCPWSDGKASGFRGQRNRNSLSPFSPEEAGITKVKRTPSFSAKANDTFHLQETLAGFEIPLFDEKLHSNSAQFKSVFTAKTPWMSAAFPWFYVYIQHQTVVPLLGLSKPQLRHQPRFSDYSHVHQNCREDSPWFLGGGTAGLGHSECHGSSHSWERAQCWYRAQCRGPPCSCGWCPGISFYPETETQTKTIMKVQGTDI